MTVTAWAEVVSSEESDVYVPTAEDMAEFYGVDACRECGAKLFNADSPICAACDIEQWVVEMENFKG